MVKFRYLDGLRGLAALFVVFDHFAISFFPAATDGTVRIFHGGFEAAILRTPLHVLVSGNFSVCIFFVLSGFVLSAKYFQTGKRQIVLASAGKRYLRLGIPVTASVLLAYTLMRLHAFANVPASQLTGSAWLGGFWHFHPSLLGALYHGAIGVFISGTSNYDTVLWTMQTELIGSFLVFGILLAVGRYRYRWVVYAVLCALLIKTYLPCFVVGLALCDQHHSPRPVVLNWLSHRWWLPLLLAGLYLGSSPVGTLAGTPFALLQGHMPPSLSVTTTTHIIGAMALVLAIVSAPPLQRLLDNRPMHYLGHISFGLYLTHLLVVGTFASFVFTRVEPVLGYGAGFAVTAAMSAMVIWLTADVFTRLIDRPAIKLSASVYRWIFKTERRTTITRFLSRQSAS